MPAMTSKQRVQAAFAHQPVDRIPVMILLGESWLIDREKLSFKQMRELGDLGVDLIVRIYEEIHSDSVTSGLGCWTGVLEALGCPIKNTDVGAPIETKPCITDLEKYVAALDHTKIRACLEESEIIQKIMEQTRRLKKAVGESKYVCGQMQGPFSGASMMVDVKAFMILCAKKSPYIKPLLDYLADFYAELGNMYCENGADIVQTCDPCTSGDMISPRMFDQLVVPSLQRMKSQFKGHDRTMVHICGKAGMRIPMIRDLGFDGYSVDAPVELKDSLEQAGPTLTMMGNIHPIEVLRMGRPEDVYKAAMANARIAGLQGGYIMMPGCDLGGMTPTENIQAMYRASCDHAAQA